MVVDYYLHVFDATIADFDVASVEDLVKVVFKKMLSR